MHAQWNSVKKWIVSRKKGAPCLESVSHFICIDYRNHLIWGLYRSDFLMVVKTVPPSPHVLALAGMSILSMLLLLWGFENILCLWHSESDGFQTVISKSWWRGQGCTFSRVPSVSLPARLGALSLSAVAAPRPMCSVLWFFPAYSIWNYFFLLRPFLIEIAH